MYGTNKGSYTTVFQHRAPNTTININLKRKTVHSMYIQLEDIDRGQNEGPYKKCCLQWPATGPGATTAHFDQRPVSCFPCRQTSNLRCLNNVESSSFVIQCVEQSLTSVVSHLIHYCRSSPPPPTSFSSSRSSPSPFPSSFSSFPHAALLNQSFPLVAVIY